MSKTLTVAALARSMKINPKVARARIRRAMPKHKGAWEFPMAKRAQVVKVLRAA